MTAPASGTPASGTPAPGTPAPGAPATGVPATRFYEEVAVGDVLPELSIPLTRTFIVATALASRDYQDVHHDPALARERGSKDIFMNILTSNGLVDRYLAGWAGPAAVLRAIRIRLGVPNHPGDTMVLSGTVTARYDEERRVEIAVRGANSLGDHLKGTAAVLLPGREATR